MVGDQDRIDVHLAHHLVTRLQVAGLELHRALDADAAARQKCITSALAEMDDVIRLIRHAATGLDVDGDTSPST